MTVFNGKLLKGNPEDELAAKIRESYRRQKAKGGGSGLYDYNPNEDALTSTLEDGASASLPLPELAKRKLAGEKDPMAELEYPPAKPMKFDPMEILGKMPARPARQPLEQVVQESVAPKSPLVAKHILQAVLGASPKGDPALARAMEAAGDNRLEAGLGGAAAHLGAAIAGSRPDTSVFKGLKAEANQPVDDLHMIRKSASDQKKAQIEGQYDDPTSSISMTATELAKKYAPKMDFTGQSANQVFKLLPGLQKSVELEEGKRHNMESEKNGRLHAEAVRANATNRESHADDTQVRLWSQKIPKHTIPMMGDITRISQLADAAGGLGKISGVGFVEGAAPTAALGKTAQEIRQRAQNVANLYGHILYGAARSVHEKQDLERAISTIAGGHTVGQVMNGLKIIQDFGVRGAQQALLGAPPGVMERLRDGISNPQSIFPDSALPDAGGPPALGGGTAQVGEPGIVTDENGQKWRDTGSGYELVE